MNTSTSPTIEEVASNQAKSLQDILEIVKAHQTSQRVFHYSDSLAQRIGTVIGEYEHISARALSAAKTFRDQMIIDLRAVSILLTSIDNASTHREKGARLRGLSEVVESAITKLERQKFEFSCDCPQFEDVFRADFPTRHYVDRIHELEAELETLRPKEEGSLSV